VSGGSAVHRATWESWGPFMRPIFARREMIVR
jgi:hypothetical protein